MSAVITETLQALETACAKLLALKGLPEELRGTIMGIEGHAGRAYWDLAQSTPAGTLSVQRTLS